MITRRDRAGTATRIETNREGPTRLGLRALSAIDDHLRGDDVVWADDPEVRSASERVQQIDGVLLDAADSVVQDIPPRVPPTLSQRGVIASAPGTVPSNWACAWRARSGIVDRSPPAGEYA